MSSSLPVSPFLCGSSPYYLWRADGPDGGWATATRIGPFPGAEAARAAAPEHVEPGGRFVVLPDGEFPKVGAAAPAAAVPAATARPISSAPVATDPHTPAVTAPPAARTDANGWPIFGAWHPTAAGHPAAAEDLGVAYHEAGHSVVAELLGAPVASVELTPADPDDHGRMRAGFDTATPAGLWVAAVATAAGFVAARRAGFDAHCQGSDRRLLDQLRREVPGDAPAAAARLLADRGVWDQVRAVARALVGNGRLGGPEFRAVVAGAGR